MRCGSHALVWCRSRHALCGCRAPMPLQLRCAAPCHHISAVGAGCHVSHWWAVRVLCCCFRPETEGQTARRGVRRRALHRVPWNPRCGVAPHAW